MFYRLLVLLVLVIIVSVEQCPRNGMLCVACRAVVVFCHSNALVMGRFLFRAQDRNMTNGDFALFTYWPQRTARIDTPWIFSLHGIRDVARRRVHLGFWPSVAGYDRSVLVCRALFDKVVARFY